MAETTFHLGYKLNNLDKDVERGVFRSDHLGPLWEETVDNTLQAALSGCVALTLDSYHVHPAHNTNSSAVYLGQITSKLQRKGEKTLHICWLAASLMSRKQTKSISGTDLP